MKSTISALTAIVLVLSLSACERSENYDSVEDILLEFTDIADVAVSPDGSQIAADVEAHLYLWDALADWHEILAVTLDGAFLCTRECLRWLNAAAGGAVINIGGLTAYTGAANRAHVVTAKAGLDGLTRALAVELAAKSITVNSVVPGLVATQRDGPTPQHHASHQTLLGRRGLPEEIAAAVRFLAGPKARYITGQTLHVNGGAYLG